MTIWRIGNIINGQNFLHTLNKEFWENLNAKSDLFLHKQWLKCAYKGFLGVLEIEDNLNFITGTEIIQILAIGPPKNLFLLSLISQEKYLKVS